MKTLSFTALFVSHLLKRNTVTHYRSNNMVSRLGPQWTTEITTQFVGGEDHLGIEGAAINEQLALVPGIISTTDHARYYSFYAWVVYRYIHHAPHEQRLAQFRGAFFMRHEAALIASSYAHHGRIAMPGLIGGRSASKVWTTGDSANLDTTYFQNMLGGLGQYYRPAMQTMGILGDSTHGRIYSITQRGEDLARAYEESIAGTEYLALLNERGVEELSSLSHEIAGAYGEQGCICNTALKQGHDRDLLLKTFFRFDQAGPNNPHVNRRRTLGVVLDMVRGAKGRFKREMVRPALYLGEYDDGLPYRPALELQTWSERWQTVAVRHIYAFGLQCLWAGFILFLQGATPGPNYEDFLDWLWTQSEAQGGNDQSLSLSLGDYFRERCRDFGLAADWKEHPQFDRACSLATGKDEYSIALYAMQHPCDAYLLIECGLRILTQMFLRYLNRHEANRDTWKILAASPRLSMTAFYNETLVQLRAGSINVGNWLDWLYHEYVLGQHEAIALEKLRYNGYDTFKFYYRDGRFYLPIGAETYEQPVRFAGIRHYQVINILLDLDLLAEDESNQLTLSTEGTDQLQRVLKAERV